MSLFWRRRERPQADERFMVPAVYPIPSTYADVNLQKAETSLQKVAVWSAVDLIASLTSELPVDVYRGTGPAREKLTSGHPWLDDPGGDGRGREDWLWRLLLSWLLRGNVVGRVTTRNTKGLPFPTSITLLHPDRVSVTVDDNGREVWRDEDGVIPPDQVWHRRVYPVPGAVLGLSPIAYHAATIGLGLSITEFGRQWFADGAHPGGMLTNSEVQLTADQAKTAKERFLAALRGTREPVVLGKGWSYQQIQIAPEESQFLESNQYTSAECARIFGPGIPQVLGYETGGSMTYSNVESRSRDLLVYALNKWLRRVERVLTEMLPVGQYARLNRDALLQSTTLERYRVHEIALRNRIRNVNEVRAIEDEPPAPWGYEPNPIPGAPESDQNTEPNAGENAPEGDN